MVKKILYLLMVFTLRCAQVLATEDDLGCDKDARNLMKVKLSEGIVVIRKTLGYEIYKESQNALPLTLEIPVPNVDGTNHDFFCSLTSTGAVLVSVKVGSMITPSMIAEKKAVQRRQEAACERLRRDMERKLRFDD